ncbi:hypothetical protein SAMN05444148_1799 [Winogradskyella jejuensis]|uniref:Uncharacterized protein n=1 Tax=Winogradskyella jejuensis TaxID=1089305 RepID=A0A1M5S8I5_9FLAO|nr:hypothetical protein SAMN05444148_1799 [Winogradskyella jejuensis]
MCNEKTINNESTTMAISNCLFLPTSENPRGFSVWCVLAKLIAKPRNYS